MLIQEMWLILGLIRQEQELKFHATSPSLGAASSVATPSEPKSVLLAITDVKGVDIGVVDIQSIINIIMDEITLFQSLLIMNLEFQKKHL